MAESQFKIDKNLYKTYINVHRAVYKLLIDNVLPQYQASTTPGLTGWDATMTIIDIFAQLDATFGKPDAQAQPFNDRNFRAPLLPMETPETLFLRLEECQEVQILANNPYTDMQLIINAVLVLQIANIFPVKEFDDWEAVQLKNWAVMKIFFHEAFKRRLNAISMNPMSGQHGYTNPNPYSIFNTTHEEDNTSTASTQHTLATTTIPPVGGTIGGSTMTPEVATALAQLSHNQNALMTQMAALAVIPPQQPPQQITVPTGDQYGGGYGFGYCGQGTGGNRGQRGGREGGRGRGGIRGRGRGSFSQATQTNNIPQIGGQITPLFGGVTGLQHAPNSIKRHNNWNYCFSCGFDVEYGHTSATCPQDWRKPGHQEGCTRQNVQQYIAAGHTASIKGQHKNQLPAGF
jgi:hypothetical protein